MNIDLKRYANVKKKSLSIKNNVKILKALIKASASTCSSVPPPQVPEPTAVPVPTQGSTPPSNFNFDSAGNVTERGKILFEIPLNLDANLLRGMNTHANYSCTGCHVERGGYSFTRLKTGTSQAPMNTFGISDQELADIAAWLNRGSVQ